MKKPLNPLGLDILTTAMGNQTPFFQGVLLQRMT